MSKRDLAERFPMLHRRDVIAERVAKIDVEQLRAIVVNMAECVEAGEHPDYTLAILYDYDVLPHPKD